jgi:hypothetical protein
VLPPRGGLRRRDDDDDGLELVCVQHHGDGRVDERVDERLLHVDGVERLGGCARRV